MQKASLDDLPDGHDIDENVGEEAEAEHDLDLDTFEESED